MKLTIYTLIALAIAAPAFAEANTVDWYVAHETIRQLTLPHALFTDLLSAFRQDVVKRRYANFAEVLDYCRRSANPIGRLVLLLHGVREERLHELADSHLHRPAAGEFLAGRRRRSQEGPHLSAGKRAREIWRDREGDFSLARPTRPIATLLKFQVGAHPGDLRRGRAVDPRAAGEAARGNSDDLAWRHHHPAQDRGAGLRHAHAPAQAGQGRHGACCWRGRWFREHRRTGEADGCRTCPAATRSRRRASRTSRCRSSRSRRKSSGR